MATLPPRLAPKGVPQVIKRLDRSHIRFTDSRFVKVGGRPREQQRGIQLLATCRTLYQGYHHKFYAENTFHLAPGPIVVTSNYFTNLLPAHRDLITSLVLTFSHADLTPEGFQLVENDISRWKSYFGHSVPSLPTKDQQVTAWTNSSLAMLQVLWWQKVLWLKSWPAAKGGEGGERGASVMMIGGGRRLFIGGEWLAEVLER